MRDEVFNQTLLDWRPFHEEAFARNDGLISRIEQRVLGHKKIAIAGLGGVGGVHLINLVRTGLRRFHLAELDSFEIANFNRQYGATLDSIGKKKLETMKNEALRINPHLEIEDFPEGVNSNNVTA